MQCFNCHYNIGGLRCVIHEQINLHNEYCDDYKEIRMGLYPKSVHIGHDVSYDGDVNE